MRNHSSFILRCLLLVFILMAFARVTWQLELKNLWWDESLSLQRAESAWLPLIQGQLVMHDGISVQHTIDQHPFFSFLLQGILIRLAGDNDFVLRFISAMAATLLVPTVWVVARSLERRQVMAPSTAYWSALLATVNPFLLWYGQEARPYALWAWLTVFTTYLLVRAVQHRGTSLSKNGWLIGYACTLVMMLTTHYFAIFILPIHAIIVYQWWTQQNQRLAVIVGGVISLLGLAVISYAAWIILVVQKGGINFERIPLGVLLPDLLNAFNMGLSVDINDVWWLDVTAGLVALGGMIWGLRSWRTIGNGGGIVALWILLPTAILFAVNLVRPAYMNARHMSMLCGGMILAVGSGLGVIWHIRQQASTIRFTSGLAVILAVLLIGGSGYSTINYFTLEEYAKDDYDSVATYLDGRISSGDVVLIYPPFSWRIFDYYLSLDKVDDAQAAGVDVAQYGVPLLLQPLENTYPKLTELSEQYQRIWFISSRTNPYPDKDDLTRKWLSDNLFRVSYVEFFSHSSLDVDLYLPEVPVYETVPADVQHPVDVVFGDQIRLVGYDLDPSTTLASGISQPLTLYWQAVSKPEHRYKYKLTLTQNDDAQQTQQISLVEREPYDGFIPTIYWDPGKTIVEYTQLPIKPFGTFYPLTQNVYATLELYRSDTLEKLTVTQADGDGISAEGPVLYLPLFND
ncbi:MAG: glycosyltransferase family 39 protein [Chloroflexota bacterium]